MFSIGGIRIIFLTTHDLHIEHTERSRLTTLYTTVPAAPACASVLEGSAWCATETAPAFAANAKRTQRVPEVFT